LTTDERGFTLVEATVAMGLLVIGLISMAEMLAVTLRMQQLGHEETAAARLAQDKLDHLRSLPWTDPMIQENAVDSLVADTPNYFDLVPGFTRRWDIAPGPDGSAELRQVSIRVIPAKQDSRLASRFDLVSVIGSGK
jgi:Tfp pilus assembly protein PilV